MILVRLMATLAATVTIVYIWGTPVHKTVLPQEPVVIPASAHHFEESFVFPSDDYAAGGDPYIVKHDLGFAELPPEARCEFSEIKGTDAIFDCGWFGEESIYRTYLAYPVPPTSYASWSFNRSTMKLTASEIRPDLRPLFKTAYTFIILLVWLSYISRNVREWLAA